MHAKLGVGSGMWEVTTRCESCAMEEARLRYPWAAVGPAGQRDDAPSNISPEDPTGAEGTGGTGGHGRASRRGDERSEVA